jgi:MmyB-like transcription regulator ligand binding domain
MVVAAMRTAAGRNPHDKGLTDLIGELVTRSDAFRLRWSAHNVASTAAAPSASTILRSGIWSSPTRAWKCPAAPDGGCSSGRPSLGPRARNA